MLFDQISSAPIMWPWLTAQYRRRLVNINVNITVASVLAALGGTVVIHLTRYIGVRQDDKVLLMLIGAGADWLIDLVLAVSLHWVANHWPETWLRSKTLIEKAEDVIESIPPPGLSVIKDAAHGTQLPHIPGFGGTQPDLTRGEQVGSTDQELPRVLSESCIGAEGFSSQPRADSPDLSPCPPEKIGFVRDATTLQLQRLCLSPVFYVIGLGGNWLMLHWEVGRELSFAASFGLAIVTTRLLHTWWLFRADPQVLQEWEDWQRQRRSQDAAEDAARAASRQSSKSSS